MACNRVVPVPEKPGHAGGMSHRPASSRPSSRRCRPAGSLPDDLHDYARLPAPRSGRPPKHDPETWTISDDGPEKIPVTSAEVDLFEAWFGDLFDELFGPCR